MSALQSLTCGKKIYRNWKHAESDAKVLRRKNDEPEAPYYCRHCQGWHVGSHLRVRRSA